jgi:hypothetical protein
MYHARTTRSPAGLFFGDSVDVHIICRALVSSPIGTGITTVWRRATIGAAAPEPLKLTFPNPCRNYDAATNRVQFWGYDRTLEITFYVEAAALRRLCPDMVDAEAGLLKAFDSARDRIHAAAETAYIRGPERSFAHILAADEFLGKL